MQSLQEVAETCPTCEGDFLSSIREPKSGKALWRDMYFYVLGDPMKNKTNKIRAYIQQELEHKFKPKPRHSTMKLSKKYYSRTPFKQKSSKKVVFHDEANLILRKSAQKTTRNIDLPDFSKTDKLLELFPTKFKTPRNGKVLVVIEI